MTIMVKTSTGVQKQPADIMVMPLIDIEEPVRPANRTRKLPPTPFRQASAAPLRALLLIVIVMLVITLASFLVGVILFSDVTRKHNAQRNVLFRCGVTSTQDSDYVVLKEAPPTASWFGVPMSEMKVYSSASDLISAKVLNNLLEDMSIEDDVENIYVHDGPRSFTIVHDFNENYTNIISAERCFLMEMIRQFVLEPASLLASFRNESALELSHAHTVFAAALPDVSARAPAAARPCLADNKPVYRLHLEGTHVLHKRSVEVRTVAPTEPAEPAAPAAAEPAAAPGLPQNDFVQFSGKHLQRITISNLDAVLKYERDNNRLPAPPATPSTPSTPSTPAPPAPAVHPKLAAGRAADE